MRVVYYALGGGHGHAVRGLAVLSQLRAMVPDSQITLLAPARLEPWARAEAIALRAPPQREPTQAELRRWLHAALSDLAPDILLVDVFPRGILGELEIDAIPSLTAPWLVTRWVRPDFYLEPEIQAVIESSYRGLIWCEEPPEPLRAIAVAQHQVPPVLIRPVEACLQRDAARAALDVIGEVPLVLGLGSGDVEHQAGLLDLLRLQQARARESGQPFALRFLTDQLPPEHGNDRDVAALFPAMAYLRAADVVVAAGGYHAFHECRALGVEAIHVPQQRHYDDQFARVSGSACATSPAALTQLLGEALSRAPRRSVEAAGSADGARAVAELVLASG